MSDEDTTYLNDEQAAVLCRVKGMPIDHRHTNQSEWSSMRTGPDVQIHEQVAGHGQQEISVQ